MTPQIITDRIKECTLNTRNAEIAGELILNYLVRIMPDNLLRVVVDNRKQMEELATRYNMRMLSIAINNFGTDVIFSCKPQAITVAESSVKQYFMIREIESGKFLKAMSHSDLTNNAKEAGTWPSRDAAIAWIEPIIDIYLEIVPVYIKHQ